MISLAPYIKLVGSGATGLELVEDCCRCKLLGGRIKHVGHVVYFSRYCDLIAIANVCDNNTESIYDVSACLSRQRILYSHPQVLGGICPLCKIRGLNLERVGRFVSRWCRDDKVVARGNICCS